MIKNVLCPDCQKLLCKIEDDGKIKKVYLYCKRCKQEKYIEELTNNNINNKKL